MTTDLEILNKHFAGKTIVRVERPSIDVSECIGQFVCTDGSVFRLHANDLGVWINGTPDELPDQTYDYKDFDKFVEGLSQQIYQTRREVKIELIEGVVRVSTGEGSNFNINFSDLSEEIQKIIMHPKGNLMMLRGIMSLGKDWRMHFTINHGCPEELLLPVQEHAP
jgi:hypothetical protein